MEFIEFLINKLILMFNFIMDFKIGGITIWTYMISLLIVKIVIDFLKLFGNQEGRRNRLQENIERNYNIKKELIEKDRIKSLGWYNKEIKFEKASKKDIAELMEDF